jgi:hypothetical protein
MPSVYVINTKINQQHKMQLLRAISTRNFCTINRKIGGLQNRSRIEQAGPKNASIIRSKMSSHANGCERGHRTWSLGCVLRCSSRLMLLRTVKVHTGHTGSSMVPKRVASRGLLRRPTAEIRLKCGETGARLETSNGHLGFAGRCAWRGSHVTTFTADCGDHVTSFGAAPAALLGIFKAGYRELRCLWRTLPSHKNPTTTTTTSLSSFYIISKNANAFDSNPLI